MNLIALSLLATLPGGFPIVVSAEFPVDLQYRALASTVRIVNLSSGYRGSGVVLRSDRGINYILTAEHVVDKATAGIEIMSFTDATYPEPDRIVTGAEVVARIKEPDIALLKLVTRERLGPGLTICPRSQAPTAKVFPALSLGCSNGAAPTCLVDKVVDRKRVRKMLGGGSSLVWEVGIQHAPGRSGGPLLDTRGNIIGVCSGSTDDRGYYCHTDELYSWLKDSGYGWLIEERKIR